jgi:hypothetical protein
VSPLIERHDPDFRRHEGGQPLEGRGLHPVGMQRNERTTSSALIKVRQSKGTAFERIAPHD